ncbi:MAG TPA: hypothetical protein DEH78_12655 [Solibacterales bacterium]|nr:hypothetical protein [Bryobacterales bacterium]
MSGATAVQNGTVYTETVVWSPPEAFVNDVPYQIAIVSLEGGGRITARIAGERVAIDDAVELVEWRGGVAYFKKR